MRKNNQVGFWIIHETKKDEAGNMHARCSVCDTIEKVDDNCNSCGSIMRGWISIRRAYET